MPQPRPLPRSLAPLPGESLPGFLLRLSYRLNQPPARIAEVTGLQSDEGRKPRVPATLVSGIPATALPVFTRMTRLTDSQAGQLGMTSWQERYPLPAVGAGRRPLASRRMLAPATRYCPDCQLDSPAAPLVNYQRRRHALQTWCIDEDAWSQLVGRLPPVPGPHQPELGDRKRQIASIYVWAQVTSGEHYFAPRPIEAAQPPEIQEAWRARRNNILHLIRRDRPSPHYTNLRTELNTLATSLARSIDSLTDSPILSPAPDRSPRRAIA